MKKTKHLALYFVICSAIFGGIFGLYLGKTAKGIYKEEYLQAALAANELTLGENARIEAVYNYTYCGHSEKVTQKNHFGEKTMSELLAENNNLQIREFSRGKVTLVFEVDDYCPKHYILKEENGKLAVYKMSRETGKQEKYLDIDIPVENISESEKKRLKEGIVFAHTSDLNIYVRNL